MVPVLSITLLGGFAATVEGRPIGERAWGSRKAQQLVKLLALAPGYRLANEQILEALWPEQDPDGLAAALRQTCYLARRALGHPDLLVVRGGVASLGPPAACAVDSVAFERAAAAARRSRRIAEYAAALACYTGPLLPDDRYADWVLVPAERLGELARGLRRELAALHEAAGEEEAAEVLWRAILADDPADEAAHVGLMGRYARQGERQRAIRQYHALHARLREDLDVAPDPATRRLYAAILGGHYPPPEASAPAPTPVAPAPLPPHRLPTSLTSLIGRAAEIAAVGALIGGETRLLTLTGAGGCGKTRLAQATAEATLPTFPDGAWWVGLAPLADGALLAGTVAQALGIRPAAGQTPLEALTDALRGRAMLLVLDNAEHLRAACADLILALLRACPALRILVTSRAALRIVGEQTWRVPSLPVPPAPARADEETLTALAGNDAVRLFVARARLIRADFVLTAANAADVAAICRRLEGLPLAIELAAARLAVLGPGQLAARLDNALGLLTGGAQGLPDRQRTLRATLDWSYDLLAPGERATLARLAVFAGGWTLAAAEAICGDADGDVLAALAGLAEHSLVQVGAGAEDEEPRYRLLEPVRQYAAGHLEAGGDAEACRARHAAFFLGLAETVEPRLLGADEARWLALLTRDLDNLRAALAYFAARDPAWSLRLASALERFWHSGNYYHEGVAWLTDGLRRAGETLPLARRARANRAVAAVTGLRGEPQAAAFATAALRDYRALGDRDGEATCQNLLGAAALYAGDYAGMWAAYTEALRLWREVGNARGIAIATANLAAMHFTRDELDAVATGCEEALPLVRAASSPHLLYTILCNLTLAYAGTGRAAAARPLHAEAIGLIAAACNWTILSFGGLGVAAHIANGLGDPARAAQFLGAAASCRAAVGFAPIPWHQRYVEHAAAAARAALGADAYAAEYAVGGAWSIEESVSQALAYLTA